MKKLKLFLAAAMLIGIGSAFTTGEKRVTEGTHYFDGERITLITSDGVCISGEAFCKYVLKENHPDNGELENYDGVGSFGEQWLPMP